MENSYRTVPLFEGFGIAFLAWYFLPAMNSWFSSGTYKVVFFACFVCCFVPLVLQQGLRISRLTFTILIYIAVIGGMALLNIEDAGRHVRVGLTFFVPYLLYEIALSEKGRNHIGKLLFLLFIITAITSALGVLTIPGAARAIMHGSVENEEMISRYQRMNIASYAFFQSMILFVPVLFALLHNKKWVLLSVLVAMGVVLIGASFMIAVMIYIFAVGLCSISCLKRDKGYKALIAILVFIAVVPILIFNGSNLLTWFANTIDNKYLSTRIQEINIYLYSGAGVMGGDLGLRFENYLTSFKTFLSNPFGIGPHYSYIARENGIGYHSQILDDLARYGVFALMFYYFFFRGYYRLLKREWHKLGIDYVAIQIVLIYICSLTLNIGMRSGQESVIIFFLIPALPRIIFAERNKRRKNVPIPQKGSVV